MLSLRKGNRLKTALILLLLAGVAVVAFLLTAGRGILVHVLSGRHGNDIAVAYYEHDIRPDTTTFAPGRALGRMTNERLREVSGIAASQRHPGLFWTIEDSGTPNAVQLINQRGQVVARYVLPGVENRDWEDVAVGGGYVYVADIGDNRRRYDEKLIYRFAEPALNVAPGAVPLRSVETLRLALPDGSYDTEALLVDPLTSDIYLLSKGNRSVVYRAAKPSATAAPVLMQRLLSLPLERATAASISPNGREVLIRTYWQAFHYVRQPNETLEQMFRRSPYKIRIAPDPQGEAITWSADGRDFYTASEQGEAGPQPLYVYKRQGQP